MRPTARTILILAIGLLVHTADAAEVEEGVGLFRAGRPLEASLVLDEASRTQDAPDRERARYYLARSLNELGMVHSAEHALLDLVIAGPDAPYASHALPGLLAIARLTGDPSALAGIVNTIPVEAYPPKVQTSLLYLQGIDEWQRGEAAAANASLAEVPQDSDLFPRARYLQGLILLQQDKQKSAVTALQEVVMAQPSTEDPLELRQLDELRNLATLQIGRVYDDLGQLERAEGFYAQVKRHSEAWQPAIAAMARIDLEQGDLPSALIRSMAAAAPALEGAPPSKAELLHARALWALCRSAEASAVLRSVIDRALPLWIGLTRFTTAHRDPEGGWRQTTTAWASYAQDLPQGSVLSAEVFEVLLDNSDLATLVHRQRRIEAEIHLISSQDRSWRDQVGDALTERLERDAAEARATAGALMLDEMGRLEMALAALLGQAEDLQASIDATSEQSCESTAPGQADSRASDAWEATPPTEAGYVDWPFNGEIWADELGE